MRKATTFRGYYRERKSKQAHGKNWLHQSFFRHIALSPMPSILDCYLGYVLGHVALSSEWHQLSGSTVHVQKPRPDALLNKRNRAMLPMSGIQYPRGSSGPWFKTLLFDLLAHQHEICRQLYAPYITLWHRLGNSHNKIQTYQWTSIKTYSKDTSRWSQMFHHVTGELLIRGQKHRWRFARVWGPEVNATSCLCVLTFWYLKVCF